MHTLLDIMMELQTWITFTPGELAKAKASKVTTDTLAREVSSFAK